MIGRTQRPARIAWIVVGTLLGISAGRAADPIEGLWATERTEHGWARIRIAAGDEGFEGNLVWLSEPEFPTSEPPPYAGRPKTDRKNPNPALRERAILGLRLLHGLRPSGDSTYRGGTIYDPETGRTYRCQARLTEAGTLRVRGFVGVSLLGRTTTWTRVPEPEAF